MRDELNPKTYFWPYDLFGYLLPGFVVVFCLIEFNEHVRTFFTRRFQTNDLLDVATLVGVAYLTGHLVAALSSLVLEHLVLRNTVGYPSYQFFGGVRKKRGGLWYLLPGYSPPYSEGFKARTRQLFEKVFGYPPEIPPNETHPGELYWLVCAYVSEKNPSGFRSATHFLELYGFSRNTSMSFFLVSWQSFLTGWSVKLPSDAWLPIDISPKCLWFIIMNFIGFIMYIHYAKLFRRQNDTVFRAFVVCSGDVESPKAEGVGAGKIVVP